MSHRIKKVIFSSLFHRILVSLFALVLYVKTLAPTVMWYDMGEYQTASYFLGIAHNTGYPLYLLLGKLFTFIPIGDIAYRVNLMSAFFGAATIFMTHLLVCRLTRSKTSAFLSALTFSLTSTLWNNATWAEVYNLNSFLSVVILYFLILWLEEDQNWQINMAVGVFGLSLGNHRLILGVGLGFGLMYLYNRLYINKSWSWWEILRLIGYFVLGFSIHLYLPIRSFQGAPVLWAEVSDFSTFINMVTTGYSQSQSFFNPFGDLNRIRIMFKMLTVFPMYEWTLIGLLIGMFGAYWNFVKSRVLFFIEVVILGFTVVMVSVYGIHDIFNYYHPIYFVFAIWFGFGVMAILNIIGKELQEVLSDRNISLFSIKIRKAIICVFLLFIPSVLYQRNIERLDKSGHTDARNYARYFLKRVDNRSVIIADYWSRWPLKYVQLVEGLRPDVEVIQPIGDPSNQLFEEFALDVLEDDYQLYIAQRYEDQLGSENQHISKRLLAPYSIHSLPTDVVPSPKFKDLLIPRGSIYKVVNKNNIEKHLQDAALEDLNIEIDGNIILKGLAIDRKTLKVGDHYKITYSWELTQNTNKDYWVDVLFTDSNGDVRTVEGFPIWLQSHWIGGGSDPTSNWNKGINRTEVYEGIVPSRVEPGSYQIRLLVYDKGPRLGLVRAKGPNTVNGKIIYGSVKVMP